MPDYDSSQYPILLFIIIVCDIAILYIAGRFIINFLRSTKTFGLYMIFIISVLACSLPFFDFIRRFTSGQGDIALEAIQFTLLQFSIFWSASYAVFTYQSVKNSRGSITTKRFMTIALPSSIILTIIYPITILCQVGGVRLLIDPANNYRESYSIDNTGDMIMYFLIYEVLSELLPAAMISRSYYKVYKEIRKTCFLPYHRAKRILIFSLIPAASIVPMSALDTLLMILGNNRPFMMVLWRSIFLRLWTFLNIMTYWFSIPNDDTYSDSLLNDERIGVRRISSLSTGF